jgi:hypothetical protein
MDEQEQLPLPDPGSLRRVVTLRRGGLAWLAAVERALDAIGVPVRGHFVVARAPEDLDTGRAAARAERGATRIERAALRAIGLAGSRGAHLRRAPGGDRDRLDAATTLGPGARRVRRAQRRGAPDPARRAGPRLCPYPRGLAEAAQPKRKENTR